MSSVPYLIDSAQRGFEQGSAEKDSLAHLQRQQAIAQNQAASLGISHVLTSGIHPDTGAPLTPDERTQLAQRNREIQAQLQDLWNPSSKVGTVGKNLSTATGVVNPPNPIRRVTDAAHITKPTPPGPMSPADKVQQLRDIVAQYQPQPGQPEAESKQYQQQAALRSIEQNPDLSDDEKKEARAKLYGISYTGSFKTMPITLSDGRTISAQQDVKSGHWYDLTGKPIPPELLEGARTQGPQTSDTRARDDFDSYKKEHPDYKGTFEQWKTEQAGVGRNATKPETLDKQYQDILVKVAAGRPLSPDEKARQAAWKQWNQEKNIEPGVARAAAFGAARYIAVVSPQDPNNVVMMRAGDAAKAGANTPASIAFQTDKAITRYMTSGTGGTNINYFNTATDHLRILREAGEALKNGNIQAFNKLANNYATATGSAAPTNFETVKAAVAGELSKTFKGTGATNEEIALINTTLNQTQSPEQINGAIDYYTKLMDSKIAALKLQYEAGKTGKPNFPSDVDDIVRALKKGK